MRIALATPFKPLDHPRISGDVTIARDLMNALSGMGHELLPAPGTETTRIWQHPSRWPALFSSWRELRALLANPQARPDAWLTYNSYYKAPDLLGPLARRAGMPYCIFSAAYAEKRRNQPRNLPGYLLNKRALLKADHLFLNKRDDFETCSRIVPEHRLTYVRPGIPVERFAPAPEEGARLRARWNVEDGEAATSPVVVSAAMLRAGVKVDGVAWTIRALGRLAAQGLPMRLVVAGGGPARPQLEALAARELPGGVRFLGQVERATLREIYSAGDFFVFPGINEGLGMVYLEAQCCGLPCVAFDHMGAPEVVAAPDAGFITKSFDMDEFCQAIRTLAENETLRKDMGAAARRFVLDKHDANVNYIEVEETLRRLVRETARS